MALSITELRKGTIFQLEGKPYRVVEYSQKVLGRGGSIVNVKIKNLVDGKLLEKTFKGNESIESANLQISEAQFLYSDDNNAYFMNTDTFENYEIPVDSINQYVLYLKEGFKVPVQIFNDRAIGIDMPRNVYLVVTHTENAVKGDTSSAITKDAQVETGAVVRVPAFIKKGDIISVDTTTGIYRERKKE